MNDQTLDRLLRIAADNITAARVAVQRGRRDLALESIKCAGNVLGYVEMRNGVPDREVKAIASAAVAAAERDAHPPILVDTRDPELQAALTSNPDATADAPSHS
jgi:hypothetical protein